jgi:hypothetical protein
MHRIVTPSSLSARLPGTKRLYLTGGIPTSQQERGGIRWSHDVGLTLRDRRRDMRPIVTTEQMI